jgi:competence protein ComEC
MTRKKRTSVLLILIVVVIIVFVIFAVLNLSNSERNYGGGSGGISSHEIAAVYVFDVGEALSVFIDDADTEILIDGGNESDGERIADFVSEYISDDTIEYVIATHSHADHIG